MSNLRDQLEDNFREDMGIVKKKTTLEEVFQATLDKTTPETPGDLRNHRKWQEKPKETWDEWV
jgi:hypothetical protein